MFNKKPREEDNNKNKEEKRISIEMETMQKDLDNKPAEKKSFLVNNINKEENLPSSKNNKLPHNLTFKEKRKEEKQDFEKPKQNLSSRYLPNKELSLATENPFLKNKNKDTLNKKTGNQGYDNKEIPLDKMKNNKKAILFKNSLEKPNETEEVKKINWTTVGVALLAFLIAIGSGVYYYFFIIKKTNNEASSTLETPTYNNETSTENKTSAVEEITTPPEENIQEVIPDKLTALPILEIKEDNLINSIISLNKTSNPEIQNGAIYEVDEDVNTLNAQEILQNFEIIFPDLENNLNKGWIFIKENSLNSKKDIGLIFQTNSNPSELKEQILSKESELTSIFQSIYFDQVFPETKNTEGYSVSDINDNFRFYNFTQGDPFLSLDWGVVNLEDNFNVIIISTSKNNTQTILNLLDIQ